MTNWLTCLSCFDVQTSAEQVKTTPENTGTLYRCHSCGKHESTLSPQGMGAIDFVDNFAYLTSEGVKLLQENRKQEQRRAARETRTTTE